MKLKELKGLIERDEIEIEILFFDKNDSLEDTKLFKNVYISLYKEMEDLEIFDIHPSLGHHYSTELNELTVTPKIKIQLKKTSEN